MKNELISMVDFVLNYANDEIYDCYKYATFLNTPLNISMFVPAIKVGDKWEVLNKPSYDEHKRINAIGVYHNKLRTYQTAKDNVIFEGFEVKYYNCKEFKYQSEIIVFKFNDDCYINYNCYWNGFESFVDGEHYANCETIQDLIKYKPTLTKKGVEVSGLNR